MWYWKGFDHVNVDLVGPLLPSHGFTYLFNMVDRFTKVDRGGTPVLHDGYFADISQAFISCWVVRFSTPGDSISLLGGVCLTSNGKTYPNCDD